MSKTQTIEKEGIIKDYQMHEKDTGSSEVQVALLSARINHLTEHLKANKKDCHSRRGLIMMTNKRRKHLNYIKRHDLDKYNKLLERLSLRK